MKYEFDKKEEVLKYIPETPHEVFRLGVVSAKMKRSIITVNGRGEVGEVGFEAYEILGRLEDSIRNNPDKPESEYIDGNNYPNQPQAL